MCAQQFCQRQARALGLHIPQGDVERGDGLDRHPAAANGSAGPQQFGVDLVYIVRIFAKQIIGDLFGMRINTLTACALRVAKSHPFKSVTAADLSDDNGDFS
ncbi:hypothetical protein D3C73_1451480 [compost metagenome]